MALLVGLEGGAGGGGGGGAISLVEATSFVKGTEDIENFLAEEGFGLDFALAVFLLAD